MKFSPAQAARFLKNPDPAIRLVLLHGPDAGLVEERARRMVGSVVEDINDPFRVTVLQGEELGGQPGLLAGEAAAISMTGGQRVVRVRRAAASAGEAVAGFLADPVGDALVVVEAGSLSAQLRLRKSVEAAKNAVAIACYGDEEQAREALVRSVLGRDHLTISAEALDYVVAHLGSDRGVSSRELEKLALYVGPATPDAPRQVTLEDVRAVVGDAAAWRMEDVAYAAAGGNVAALVEALSRVRDSGMPPVAVLTVVGGHLQRLHQVADGDPRAGVRALRPPVHFARLPEMVRQAGEWSRRRLDHALQIVTEAEVACKTTGAPADAICGQALLRLAVAAGSRGRAGSRRA